MVFNDTTDKKGLIQDCELRTGLGDTAISGNAALLDHFTRLINQRYQGVVTMILDSQDEWDFVSQSRSEALLYNIGFLFRHSKYLHA